MKIADFGLARIYRDAMALTSVVSDSLRRTSTETLVIFTVVLLFYLYGAKYITYVSTIIRSISFLQGRGGGGVTPGILGVGVPPGPLDPDPAFQTKKCNFPHFQTWPQLFKCWIALTTG